MLVMCSLGLKVGLSPEERNQVATGTSFSQKEQTDRMSIPVEVGSTA